MEPNSPNNTHMNTDDRPYQPEWPRNLIAIIVATTAAPSPTPTKPEFAFELTLKAAHKNLCVVRKHGLVEKAIKAQQNSPVGYGSEFCPTLQLAPILHRHPNWPQFRQLLEQGSLCNENERKQDVDKALTFGNHKGATEYADTLHTLILDDVIHGFSLPLPLHRVASIPGILLAPMNIVSQDTIDHNGNTILKHRLTHDQSFAFSGSNTSINSRLRKDELNPCYFGWVVHWLVNCVAAAQQKYPGKRIFATKVDFKSAYRRLHMNYKIAIQSCTHFPAEGIPLMAIRLTFRGAACPFDWSTIFETICNLATAISHDDD